MAGLMSTTAPADVTDRLQTYFSKKLLEHARYNLRIGEFGMKAPLPRKASSKTIRWFRKREAATTDVVTLTEGTPITTFTQVTLAYVEATLVQYGEASKITDILRIIDAYEPLKMCIDTMGEDAALHADTITRNAVVGSAGGLHNIDTTSERFAGVAPTLDSSADFTTFHALSAANAKFTRARALACITTLKANRTPRINGKYIAIIAPEVMHDAQQDSTFLDAWTRSDVKKIYMGELGTVDGVMYVEANNAFREGATYGTYSATGVNFTTLFFGKHAYGVPNIAGGASPWKPQIIINDKPDKADPLNQFMTAGWKSFWAAKLLNAAFICALRTKSTLDA